MTELETTVDPVSFIADTPGEGEVACNPGALHVVVDPAVERLPGEVGGYHLLAHGHFETGLAIPPGEGLVELFDELIAEPVAIETLYRSYAERHLIDAIIGALVETGFAYLVSAPPGAAEIGTLRQDVETRLAVQQRAPITIDLDAPDAAEALASLAYNPTGLDLRLRCARIQDHGATLIALAARRQAGEIRLYDLNLRTPDPHTSGEIRAALGVLGASVIIEDVAWPHPSVPIPGIEDLTRAGVAVHAVVAPGRAILDEGARAAALRWATQTSLTGLRLRIEPEAGSDETLFAEILDAVDALEERFGDVLVETLPGDGAILGVEQPDPTRFAVPGPMLAFRRHYLRRRLPMLKALEGDNLWSQIPEAEDKLVRLEDDLLPANPALLGLEAGSRLVDVCGGLGRVARRLAPHVGADGQIVSIEMLRLLSERARDFATQRGFNNLSFRVGLAQRLPLPDNSMDAAVNEWTGGIWELGLGPPMLAEMARVVRPGGRVAVTHRLIRLPLQQLGGPWVQYEQIYDWIRDAFARSGLEILNERIWGQMTPTLVGERATQWRKQYVRSVVDPFDFEYESEVHSGPNADVFLTVIARKPG